MGNIEQFDRIALRYDTPERSRLAAITAQAICSCLKGAGDKTAIDFGCGTGLVGLQLAGEFRSILLLDASQPMVDITAQKIAEQNIPNAKAVCLDFEAKDHPDMMSDYIIMVNVLIHIREYRTLLSRLYGHLNMGGHLLIADFDRNEQIRSDMVHPGFDQEDLKALLRGIGFRDASSHTFFQGSRLFMDQDASLFLMDAKK